VFGPSIHSFRRALRPPDGGHSAAPAINFVDSRIAAGARAPGRSDADLQTSRHRAHDPLCSRRRIVHAQGQVIDADVNRGGTVIVGRVRGSAPMPYQQMITLRPDHKGVIIHGTCSCLVRSNCFPGVRESRDTAAPSSCRKAALTEALFARAAKSALDLTEADISALFAPLDRPRSRPAA